ncbi:MAG: hypothetical protein K8R88_11520 [Armatimonadetes bacterium]|nr:hypothetical protein [Armatimonadota bacterium]
MRLAILIGACATTTAAFAGIVNGGFENPSASAGNWTSAGIPGWSASATGTTGVWNIPRATYFTIEAAEGTNIGYTNGYMAQQVTDVLAVGKTTLSLFAGRRTDNNSTSFLIELWTGGTVTAGNVVGGTKLADTFYNVGLFAHTTHTPMGLTYTANVGHPQIGQPLTVRFVRSGPNEQIDIDDVQLNSPFATAVSGQLTLADFSGNVAAETVTIEVRSLAGATLETHYNVPLSASGAYSFTTRQTGPKVMSFKGRTWLTKKTGTVDITAGATGVNAALPNGDCNSDDVVDLTDYTIIATAFNAFPSSGNWDVRADLNGDEVVDLTDYTIVVTNFNLVGE